MPKKWIRTIDCVDYEYDSNYSMDDFKFRYCYNKVGSDKQCFINRDRIRDEIIRGIIHPMEILKKL